MLKNHPNYKNAIAIKPKGLMLHSVGCAVPNADRFVKSRNTSNISKGVHAIIDSNTGNVHQLLPWTYRAWHCGGSGNSTHIAVEMCESNCIKYVTGTKFNVLDRTKAINHAKTTYESAVELFAMLCKSYKLNPLTDIVSHSEGNKKGIASNHGDPELYWKGLGLPYTMDGFRKDVDAIVNPKTVTTPTVTTGYKVKVTADVLNVRSGAGVLHKKVTQIKKGEVYTITLESNGWGRLKSGAGWISLKYTKRV